MKRGPTLVVLGLLALAIALPITGGQLGFGASPSPSAGGGLVVATPTPAASGVPLPSTGSESTPTPAVAEPTPVPTTTLADIPIVPVTSFRAAVTSSSKKELAAVLAGTSKRYDALELVKGEADAVLAALGVERPADAARLVEAKDATKLAADLAKNRKRLAFLRADAVGPQVRALAWGGKALFGVDRLTDTSDWALRARLPAAPAGQAFDASKTWTLFAGGDIMLDRGVAQTLKINGKGADFPFAGGTAEITSRCKDCSPRGWDLPRTRRTGNAGALRDLVKGADIAIANFENPAPDKFRYHTSGVRFSADPKLIKGLATAGIDWVGLANNHIGDAGGAGILQTIKNLGKYDIRSGGAGKNIAAARKPSILDAGGAKVAILAYDTIARGYTADADTAGSARLTAKVVKADVKKARAAGADLVIVFPHWGTEYHTTPFAGQQALARASIDAGADLVIGNHAHYAAAMEVYEGKPIWYALGNFVFDQTWSEPTMEGITLELTFHGTKLVQARMRPHIILDKAQPNFMDPAGSGKVVMGQIFDASKGLLPW